MRGVLPGLLAAAVCLLAAAPSATAGAVAPRSAAAFRDSVGVNTHIVYYDTAYGDWPRVVAKLRELGVRHLRDGIYGNPSWRDWNERYYQAVNLAASRGMRFTFMMGRPGNDAGTLDQLIGVAAGRLRPAAEALESPNEFDYFVGGRRWPSVLSTYVRELHRRAKAQASLRSLPVLGPSLKSWEGPQIVGDESAWLDRGSIHPYSGGLSPTPEQVRSELLRARALSGDKPLWATEAGFHNALRTRSGHPPVSEAAGAVYVLRTVLQNFESGIGRTYLYELLDEKPEAGARDPEQHFGLLRDDFSPKPAFTALKNLLTLVGDGVGPPNPRPLRLSISGADGDVRRLVLEKGDGTYLVVLWRLASVWDTANRRPLRVARRSVTIDIAHVGHVAGADPIASAALRGLRLRNGRVRVDLGGTPIVLHVTPKRYR